MLYIYIYYIMHRIQGHPPEAQRATAGGATWTGFVDFVAGFNCHALFGPVPDDVCILHSL